MMRYLCFGLAVTTLAVLVGCADMPREAGFDEVSRLATERTGKNVHWLQGTAEDESVAARVRELLSHDMNAHDSVQIALLNNRGLQATYEELGVARANLVQAGLLSNPVLSGQIKAAISGPGPEVELSLTQNFLELLYIPMRKKVAEARFEESKQRVAAAVIDLATRVRTRFHIVQMHQSLMGQRELLEAAADASHDAARRLHEAGNIPDTDLYIEHARHAQALLDLADARAALALSRQDLSRLMGVWGDDSDWVISESLPDLPESEINTDTAETLAVERSLDLAAARGRIASAAKLAGLMKSSALLPELSLGAAAKRETQGDWLLGPAFTLPIPLLDQGQARTAGAQAELRRARFEYDNTLVHVHTATRSAVLRLNAAREKALSLRDVILPLHRRITQETQLQYNGMLVGVFQLLDAKRQEINSDIRYIAALGSYWSARAELEGLLAGRVTDLPSSAAESSALTPSRTLTQGH